MNDKKAQIMFNQANELFGLAKEELARPEEDVVCYLVCHNVFKAIEKYLSAFITLQGKEINASYSIEHLLRECRLIEPKFHELNLDALYKKDLNEDVYMDMSTVNHYMALAEQTRSLVYLPVVE